MKKKGFISTTLIYTFFFVFLSMMTYLLSSYNNTRMLLERYSTGAKETIASLNDYDVVVNINVKNASTGGYDKSNKIPEFGYVLNSELSSCEKSSIAPVFENGKVKFSISNKDVCDIYFDRITEDITINIYTYNSAGDRIALESVPGSEYEYDSSKTECQNGEELTYADGKFTIAASKKTICNVYFNKKTVNDVTLVVFKQDYSGPKKWKNSNGVEKRYSEVLETPTTGYSFSGYDCPDLNKDDTNYPVITYNNGYTITNSTNTKCNVYFDINLEDSEIYYYEENNTGTFVKVSTPSNIGYELKEYKCDNKNAKVVVENNNGSNIYKIESNTATICNLYFKKSNNDVARLYYIESSYGSNKYEITSYVPQAGFRYDHSNCKNGSTVSLSKGVPIINNNGTKDTCELYYKMITTDVKVSVYVKNRITGEYEIGNIPEYTGYTYQSKGCKGGNGSISYENGKLKVTSDGPTSCEVYFS